MNWHTFTMSQLCCSASRWLIISAIICALVCQAASRRWNHNDLLRELRERRERERSYENSREEIPNPRAAILHQLSKHNSEELRKNWFYNSKMRSPSDYVITTSCGRKNCQNITNYPLELINDLLDNPPTPLYPKEEDDSLEEIDYPLTEDDWRSPAFPEFGRSSGSAGFMGRSAVPKLDWKQPKDDDDENDSPKNRFECEILADVFSAHQAQKYRNMVRALSTGHKCQYKLNKTEPQETVDEKANVYKLVNDNRTIIVRGYECIAGTECIDHSLSMGWRYECITHYVNQTLCILNSSETAIIARKVAIADGCNCESKSIA